jgi:hypothetical protein
VVGGTRHDRPTPADPRTDRGGRRRRHRGARRARPAPADRGGAGGLLTPRWPHGRRATSGCSATAR